jgi:nucleoside phosphorylase
VAKLGDVVISTEVHWTNVHKLKPPADPALAKSQPDLAVYQVWNRAQFAPESGWLGVMEHYFEHHEEDLPSNWSHPPIAKPAQDSKAPREYWPDATQKVAFGPLLATNHVVDHAGLRDKHKGEAKAIGIEMESAGVFAAIALHNNVSVRPKPPRAAGFVFKGVSDHCSQKGDNAWRQIAGSNAAYAALTFIFCNLAFIDHQIPAADRAVKQKRRTSSAYQQRMRNRRTK